MRFHAIIEEMLRMENLMYVFRAVLVIVSVFSVIFCIARGKGASHKWLMCFAAMFCLMAMICFGGQAVLNHFDMGWRCTPFNTMLFLCAGLFIITLGCCMYELRFMDDIMSPTVIACVSFSLFLTMIAALALVSFYLSLSSWHDGLSTYNGQTIVYMNDQHGGSCSWRYYNHINSFVHGAEITTIHGWHGNPPRF